jgi:formylglycine-generating enzyme required for sulfatase activity
VNAFIDEYPASAPAAAVPVNDPAFAAGATAEGIMHLLGNVWEWTLTPAYCGAACTERWDGQQAAALELRGWGWASAHLTRDTWATAITEAQPAEASVADIDIGFRCAHDIEGVPSS